MPVDVAKIRIQLLAQSPLGNAYHQKGEGCDHAKIERGFLLNYDSQSFLRVYSLMHLFTTYMLLGLRHFAWSDGRIFRFFKTRETLATVIFFCALEIIKLDNMILAQFNY